MPWTADKSNRDFLIYSASNEVGALAMRALLYMP